MHKKQSLVSLKQDKQSGGRPVPEVKTQPKPLDEIELKRVVGGAPKGGWLTADAPKGGW